MADKPVVRLAGAGPQRHRLTVRPPAPRARENNSWRDFVTNTVTRFRACRWPYFSAEHSLFLYLIAWRYDGRDSFEYFKSSMLFKITLDTVHGSRCSNVVDLWHINLIMHLLLQQMY